MISGSPNFDMLSAYVDGELSADEAEELERLVNTDVGVRRQVDALRVMKARVAGLGAEVIVVRAPRRSLWSLASWAGVAAALVAAILAGLLLVKLPHGGSASMPLPETVAEALAFHDRWIVEPLTSVTQIAAVPGFVSPDIEAAGLSLETVRTGLIIDGHSAVQAGYVGRHGCRLSLFQFDYSAGDAFHINAYGRLQSATWARGQLSYLIVARDMDDTRFAILAATLKTMTTGKDVSPTAELVAQLRSAHQACRG